LLACTVRCSLVALALVIELVSQPGFAQSSPPVALGEQIRWILEPGKAGSAWAQTVPDRHATGTVVGWESGALQVVVRDRSDTLVVLPADLRELQVKRGRPAASEGMVLGAVVGATLGWLVAALTYEEPPPCPELFCNLDTLFDEPGRIVRGVLIGGAVGGVLGRLVGSEIQVDRWQDPWTEWGVRFDQGTRSFETSLRFTF